MKDIAPARMLHQQEGHSTNMKDTDKTQSGRSFQISKNPEKSYSTVQDCFREITHYYYREFSEHVHWNITPKGKYFHKGECDNLNTVHNLNDDFCYFSKPDDIYNAQTHKFRT